MLNNVSKVSAEEELLFKIFFSYKYRYIQVQIPEAFGRFSFFLFCFCLWNSTSFWSFYVKIKLKMFLKFHSPWKFSGLGFFQLFPCFSWLVSIRFNIFFFFCLIVQRNYFYSCILQVWLNANHKTLLRGLCRICLQLFSVLF